MFSARTREIVNRDLNPACSVIQDKLIVDTRGQATISNDGATIMKLLDVVHPAAKTLVDIARAQDAEVGDGTTSVVLLAGELLKECRGYVEEGVSPHVIIKGYRKSLQLALGKIEEMAVTIKRDNEEYVWLIQSA